MKFEVRAGEVGIFGSIKGHEYVCFADTEQDALALAGALLENRLSANDARWAKSRNPFTPNTLGRLAGKNQQGNRVEARVRRLAVR